MENNSTSIIALKILKRIYEKAFGRKKELKPSCVNDPDLASDKIRNLLDNSSPSMIARFGSTELTCLVNYIGIKSNKKSWPEYIKGNIPPWWWNKNTINQMNEYSGFFPLEISEIEKFCDLMIRDIQEVDLLGSWLAQEKWFDENLHGKAKVDIELLNPYFSKKPWTSSLEGKKILVIHPFSETINSQYKKRNLIFKNNLLPEFELKTIKAVQSIAGETTKFATWFDALESMKNSMDEMDYDICLIGCGAYGFPLAAHAKRQGKKGFHLGGSLQLLFGIRGKRWENKDYNSKYNYSGLMNEHWVKPSAVDRPTSAKKVEGACYW